MGEGKGCSKEVGIERDRFGMGKFSPTKQHGECEEIANPSTAYGRRRRNWIDAYGAVPTGQVVDASCGKVRIDVAYCNCSFFEFPFSSSPIFNQASRCTSSKRSSASLIQ